MVPLASSIGIVFSPSWKAYVGQPTCVKLVWLWERYVLRVMVCARLPDSTLLKQNPGCLLGCHEGLGCIRHYNRCLKLFESFRSLWPGTGERISPTAIYNELLFKIAVRSNRLCILVAGLLDAFVTAYNLQRTSRGSGLNFKELMYGMAKRKHLRHCQSHLQSLNALAHEGSMSYGQFVQTRSCRWRFAHRMPWPVHCCHIPHSWRVPRGT